MLPSSEWRLDTTAPGANETITVHVMMHHTPERLAALEKTLYAVSDPQSPQYGQHLSLDDLAKLTPIAPAAVNAVEKLFARAQSLKWNHNRDIAAVTLTAAAAEAAFDTVLGRFTHARVKNAVLLRALRPYSLPANVAEVVDAVGDLVVLPRLRGETTRTFPVDHSASNGGGFPGDCGSMCNSNFVTPGVVKQRYGVSSSVVAAAAAGASKNSMAVAEFQRQYYDQADLDQFNNGCGTNVKVSKFIGKNDPSACTRGHHRGGAGCVEALLDVEYIGAVAGGSVPLTVIYANRYSLLDWVHQISSMADAPLVHSVSYGNDEKQQASKGAMQTTNTQFMKAGARGLSILFASGDQGVCGREGCGYGVLGPKRYKPDFPAGCPSVTAVGGTNFLTQGTIGDESVWSDGGGGFSDTFGTPSFQAKIVAAYLANREADLPPPTIYKDKEYPVYNNTGRGYPDVAALGGSQNPYCIISSGQVMGVAGTSAATPVTAAVFALLNGIRLGAGRPALGWLNPFIYQNAAAFHDVTHGSNNAGLKGIYGFFAIKGWDAASGVGTPNLAALKTAVDALP